jgi:two-component system sensor kinase FixL
LSESHPVRAENGADDNSFEQSKGRSRVLTNSIPTAVALVGPDLQICTSNDQFMQLNLFAVNAKPCYLTDVLGDSDELHDMCKRAFEGEYFRFNFVIEDINGEKHTCEISMGPELNQKVNEEKIFIIIVDISEEVEDHRNSFQNRSALAEVQRMSLVGGIAAGLTHELAQPLAAIGGYAAGGVRRLQSGNASHDDLAVLMQKISHQVERAGKTLRLMCDFSQKHSDQMTVFDINMLIAETCNVLDRELRIKNIKIEQILCDGLGAVQGDRAQIQQVLVNLIQNSVEEISGQSEIEGEITIGSEASEAGTLMIKITDNGQGFDDQLISNAFAPFYTRKKGGAGMGLTISETIIEGHEGEIWIDPNFTDGALVIFSLPTLENSNDIG